MRVTGRSWPGAQQRMLQGEGDVVQSGGGQFGARERHGLAQLVASLGQGMLGLLQPLLLESITAERNLLMRAIAEGSAPADAAEDLANLNIMGGAITDYERRWRSRFGRPAQAWPRAAESARAAFSLVSDDELQGQLIGQPAIESLDRRNADVLDTLQKRLWMLAAELGAQQRPDNPFSPRYVVEAFLDTFTPGDCGARLRGSLLRTYGRLAGPRLGEAYDWLNRQLAEAGVALAAGNDFATLAATTVSAQRQAVDAAKLQVWGEDNAVAPVRPGGREAGSHDARHGDAVRGTALRHAARMRRAQQRGPVAPGVRMLGDEEFLAVLSLLQVEPAPLQPAGEGHAAAARRALAKTAGNLGIDSSTAAPSDTQEDAIDVVGGLFDALAAGHLLQAGARQALAALVLPYLRLALEEPRLFEREQPPAMRLLSRLLELWDGNGRATAIEEQLHAIADEAAREVVAEYHGERKVFDDALARLESALAPLWRRTSLVERRTWQAIEGGERLEAARAEADRALDARLANCALLPEVAGFLGGHWRQSLVQAWLRAGAGSDRFAEVAAVGDALVRLDALAATGEGAAVASALIDLQPRLHACCLASGLDAQAAEAVIAGLVAALARPDAARLPQERSRATAGTGEALPDGGTVAGAGAEALAPGRRFVQPGGEDPPRALRLAWRSPLTGNLLLVNAQGAREYLLEPAALAAMLADGRLLSRPAGDPVEAALQYLDRR